MSENGTLKASYVYDDLGQLVRENNKDANKTWVYTYDDRGNITSKKTYSYTTGTLGTVQSTDSYSYYQQGETAMWGDGLKSYNGSATFTYDAIGNPLTYNNGSAYTFTWQNGRQLASGTKGSTSFAYTYNADGLRTRKVVGSKTYDYYWFGSQLAMMTITEGSNVITMKFYYDDSGRPMILDYNDTKYFYVTNLQGDVVSIVSTSGEIGSYTYDAWGNPISTGSSAILQNNPLRYRGYIYDTETGFYYLQSRYYDPAIGRFINADGYVSTGQGVLGNNMFAYCGNNPVNRVDHTGQFWSEILEFAKTAVAEIGKAMGLMSPAYVGCGGAALGDGPLPFGDIAGLAGAALLTVGAIGYGFYQATQAISIPNVEEKENIIVNTQPKKYGTTYYHSTTPEAAAAIIATETMVGSSWEGGYVYAWRNMPSQYAIDNSGAHFGVVISFKTDALFIDDPGIEDPLVKAYNPVVSALPGPIVVWDVEIVG